jgi:branched-chain amino acid transport system ATP-binding protein
LTLLYTKELTKHFGGLIAVNKVSFEVEKGEIVGVIGPNGAGKTTLLNLITGFLKPDFGIVSFDGEDITGWKPFDIVNRGIARTFQIVRPFRHLSAIDNVMISLASPRSKTRNRVNSTPQLQEAASEILKLVGLYGLRHELAGNFSHGDLRRLEIARALATYPELLLLDEPFSGLNLIEIESLSEYIMNLRSKGLSLLIIEHKLEQLFKIVDKVIVLHYGEKIAEGKPAEVVKNKKVLEVYIGEE